jgi:ubiquinone/menaquinone biosynthesis C-methylase UbiE
MSTPTSIPNSHYKEEEPVEDAWSVTARDYSNQITRLTSLYANDLILLLHPYITKAKVILDVGCGAGAFVHAYLQQYPQGIPGQTIISSDLSPAMLEQARLSTSQSLKKGKAYGFCDEIRVSVRRWDQIG